MAYSGTTSWGMNADQILQAGWSRIGGEDVTQVEAKQGMVALNLLVMDYANKGINLWTVERGYIDLLEGTGRYLLAADTIDIENATLRQPADAVRRTTTLGNDPFSTIASSTTVWVTDPYFGGLPGDGVAYSGATATAGFTVSGDYTITTVSGPNLYTIESASAATGAVVGGGSSVSAEYAAYNELPLFSISRDDFAFQPNKYITGQPYGYWFDRQINPYLNVLYIPSQDGWQLIYYRTRRIYDVTSMRQDLEFPFRFVPSLVSGMAYFLSDIRSVGPGAVPIERRQELKARYEQDLEAAIAEDVELAPLRIAPDFTYYFR